MLALLFWTSLILICFTLLVKTFYRHRRYQVAKRHLLAARSNENTAGRPATNNISKRIAAKSYSRRLYELRERTGLEKLSVVFLGSAIPSCALGLVVFWLLSNVFLVLVATLFSTTAMSYLAFRRLVRRRHAKFVRNLPDAIDTVVRAVTTGLPLADGFAALANEGVEPIRSEFARVLEARKLGSTIPEALNGLAERISCPETRFLATVIDIQTHSGGSIAEALTNLSNVLRDRYRIKEKVRAMAAEAKASAYIIGSLPFFIVAVISYTSPDYMNILLTTFVGHIAIAACLIWMGIGVVIMRKMINFEV
ncbi:type II secretion system F family protein [Brucella intermedia]|uniref:type II secretion system F family protein n=1 Tax=Brucella intermedia TaxID=94625 RepID=UPI00046A9A7C|nr:type II secretion system F family protein [Brucella intermedia]